MEIASVLRVSQRLTFLQLLVDKASGATTVLQNKYASGLFTFSSLGVVTGSASCTEGYGREKHDLGVRWNDIDGDGELAQCMPSALPDASKVEPISYV